MRAFDLNFARAARIFDPNFMRAGRKPARPRDKIPSSARLLRGDEILNGGEILSDRALNVGEILSGGILNDGKFWIDNKILKGCEILKGVGILNDRKILRGAEVLNRMSRGGIRRGFCRWILRELYGKTSLLRMRCKFQSASGSQTDYKFKRATALQTGRKFKKAASLRTACKFKASMQKFHRGFCAAVELLRQKLRSETMPHNCLKFQSLPYALARSKFQGAMSEIGAGSLSVPLKFQISVAALLQLKFRGVPNAITRLKFQSAVVAVAAFARSKFRGLLRAAQCRKIRAQGQGG
ncbi:hypothetical protein [uncultured Campylobacter sp.]|uniref:hypothetical protein n=1 Tax=uncultured Campylobacter sp. TaxID=218934 RepID=UPI002616522E|nr:hypothetical protein [uncultured Campylobacter sp.]